MATTNAKIYNAAGEFQLVKIWYFGERRQGQFFITELQLKEPLRIEAGDLKTDLSVSVAKDQNESPWNVNFDSDCEIEGILYWKVEPYNVDELSWETGVREFAI